MIKDTEEFYNKTKFTGESYPENGDNTPVEYIHIFHKEYPRLPSVKLSKDLGKGEYVELLRKRKSIRSYSNKPISIKVLAKILSSCKIVTAGPYPFERRTYPSAGARFPIEIYLIAFRIKGLEPGAYHLNISKFSLETLLKTDLRKYEPSLTSSFINDVAGALIFTTVISRAEVKYGIRAYPYSLIEVGHMGQNVLLSCTKHKIGSCAVGGFVNDDVTKLLDLTEDELPIYAICFGFPKPSKE